MSRDAIELAGIRAYGRHGALPRERDRAQPFDLAVRVELDLAAARASDDLADTLDYAAAHARIVAIVEQHSYALLERLADEIARDVLRDPRATAVRVTIAKPHLLGGATPSVTVFAERA